MSAELASENRGYDVLESEPPELLGRNLAAAGYLLAGATAFFFLAFLFAFFYLRSVDKPLVWKPPGVDASIGWGTAIVACWVVSAVLVRLGAIDQRSDRRAQWRFKGFAALGLGFAGLVLQVIAWTQSGFGPTDGAFASVYVGWTGFMFVWVLGSLLWLEMTLATSWRYRNEPRDSALSPVVRNTAELAALGFLWTFVVGVAVLTWVVLYLVA